MLSLPKHWTPIPAESGSFSRGLVHPGLVPGVEIRAEHFNGVYCIGQAGADTFVVSGDSEGGAGYDLCVVRRHYAREREIVRKFGDARELFDWIIAEGGAALPRETLEEIATPEWLREVRQTFPPSYAVHTYAVVRIKTIGDAPREGETLQQFAERVSDAVAAGAAQGLRVRGLSVEGSDVEHAEYADEVSAVLVDEIRYGEDGEIETVSSFFDDHMEPNDGNGTDPARYARLRKLVESIAATPLQGEPCPDAPGGEQSWTDREHVLERLTEIVNQCREATRKE